MIEQPNASQLADDASLMMEGSGGEEALCYYKIYFRELGQRFTANAHLTDLVPGDRVMVRMEHGIEPATIADRSPGVPAGDRAAGYPIQRRVSEEEDEKYTLLAQLEHEAFLLCKDRIQTLHLPMHLVRVERFFNGSKIIFYFTAESRVDFRELVKVLVHEFRTRIEMRQIGVRHETQMIGGIGHCGRELCCSLFLTTFDSVSIKMAKAQDLPLNPAKISGLCNRLLCCLTYEYETYKTMKKGMPRVGRQIEFEGTVYQVTRLIPLLGQVATISSQGEERVFTEEEWRSADPVLKTTTRKNIGKRGKKMKADAWKDQEEAEEK